MAFGFGFSLTAIAKAVAFSVRSLFRNNEPGVWYDPSDFSTMFQDAAGTTPVTAVEQPVGLILDKSKGLVLGSELIVQPINFNANWIATSGGTPVASGSSFTTSSIGGFWINALTPGKTYQVTVTGTTTADSGVTLRQTNTTTTSQIRTGFGSAVFTAQSGFTYFYVRNESAGTTTVTSISVRELPGNHATQTTTTSRPGLSARVNLLTATETLATQTVTTRATTQTLRFEGAGTVTLSGTATGTYSAGSHSITTTAGDLTLTVSGTVTKADLRATNMGVGLPAYQRVNTSTDYDTTGFPLYLRFDGVDDWLVTPSIDFTSTDKMTVFAGVRKLSDATRGIIVEQQSVGLTGGVTIFALSGPQANGASNYAAFSSISTVATATVSAPSTNVLTGIFAQTVSTAQAALKVNGGASIVADGPTVAAMVNQPITVGRRGDTTLPFNGRLYGLIVRGAQSTAQQIANAEKWVNSKTRAY